MLQRVRSHPMWPWAEPVLLGLLSAFLVDYGGQLLAGALLFVIVVVSATPEWRTVAIRVFGCADDWLTSVMAATMSLAVFGHTLALAVVGARLTPLVIGLAVVAHGYISFAFSHFARRVRVSWKTAVQLSWEKLKRASRRLVRLKEISPAAAALAMVYAILFSFALFVLWSSRTGVNVVSPWQIISPSFIYIFGAATLVLGFLLLARIPRSIWLALLVAQTFLLHSYLPLTHETLYGADGWRHIASVDRLVHEEPLISPTLVGDALPAARFGLVGYSELWGLMGASARLMGVSGEGLIPFTAWFGPVLWSLFVPLLVFLFFKTLGLSERVSRALAWASLLPFAWQVSGAMTLPVSFGFIEFLVALTLLARRLNDPHPAQIPVLLGFGGALFFGYTLYWIVFWVAAVAAEVFVRVPHLKKTIAILVTTIALLILPAVEVASGYSRFVPLDWWRQVKLLVGSFSGWYLAAGPRGEDITQGNIIFNLVPQAAFVPNWFTQSLLWLPFAAVLIWVVVCTGLIFAWQSKNRLERWFASLAVSLFGGYILMRYFSTGENILTRRLDPLLALCLLVLIGFFAHRTWVFRWRHLSASARAFCVPCIAIVSILITVSFSLGPDTNTVSRGFYRAMALVWDQEQARERHCVIADTYPLLALEAFSRKSIVGGGFPIDQFFAQPERLAALNRLESAADGTVFRSSASLIGASQCWFVTARPLPQTANFPAEVVATLDDVTVWRYTDQTSRNL